MSVMNSSLRLKKTNLSQPEKRFCLKKIPCNNCLASFKLDLVLLAFHHFTGTYLNSRQYTI